MLTRGAPRGLDGTRQGCSARPSAATAPSRSPTPGTLYFYAHEGKYQVLCHDVVEYGGRWLVVQPDGHPAP